MYEIVNTNRNWYYLKFEAYIYRKHKYEYTKNINYDTNWKYNENQVYNSYYLPFMHMLKVLAQRSIALVLMMINSYSYSTNDLVFIQSQICDQDLSRCVASTKDLKSSFGAYTVWSNELVIEFGSCLNQVKKMRRLQVKTSRSRLVSRFVFIRFYF